MLLRNFQLRIYGHATIHHIKERRRLPFAIDNLPFGPSTDNLPIYVHAKNQSIILKCRRGMILRNFRLGMYGERSRDNPELSLSLQNGNTPINQLRQHQGKRGKEIEEENIASACAIVQRMCWRGKEISKISISWVEECYLLVTIEFSINKHRHRMQCINVKRIEQYNINNRLIYCFRSRRSPPSLQPINAADAETKNEVLQITTSSLDISPDYIYLSTLNPPLFNAFSLSYCSLDQRHRSDSPTTC